MEIFKVFKFDAAHRLPNVGRDTSAPSCMDIPSVLKSIFRAQLIRTPAG
jgi:hypothetical protein